MYECLC